MIEKLMYHDAERPCAAMVKVVRLGEIARDRITSLVEPCVAVE